MLGLARLGGADGLAHQPGQVLGALDAAAHVGEQPVGAARHVLGRQARQRGGAAHQRVQIEAHIGSGEGCALFGRMLQGGQGMDGAPGVQRQAVPHRPGGLFHPRQQSLKPAADLGIIDQALQLIRQFMFVGNLVNRRIAGLAEGDQQLAGHFQGGRRFIGGAPGHRAQDAHEAFRALGIAAQPEQIVHGARRRGFAQPLHVQRFSAIGKKAEIVHRGTRQHPGILGRGARLHGQRPHRVIGGDARQPARHHHPAGRRPGGEDAQRHRARRELAILEHRRHAQRRDFLHHHGFAAALQLGQHALTFLAGQVHAQPRRRVAREQGARIKGIAQDGGLQPAHRLLAAPFGAAPDGGDVGNLQLFAQQRQRHRRQIGVHGRRFDHAAAQRIGQHHAAGAHRLHQPRHTQRAVAAKLQRIAEVAVHAAEDGRDALQAGQCFQKHFAIAHRQVVALHKRQAQVMRQIDMFEIGFVVRPRRQQHGAVAPRLAQRQDAFLVGVEE